MTIRAPESKVEHAIVALSEAGIKPPALSGSRYAGDEITAASKILTAKREGLEAQTTQAGVAYVAMNSETWQATAKTFGNFPITAETSRHLLEALVREGGLDAREVALLKGKTPFEILNVDAKANAGVVDAAFEKIGEKQAKASEQLGKASEVLKSPRLQEDVHVYRVTNPGPTKELEAFAQLDDAGKEVAKLTTITQKLHLQAGLPAVTAAAESKLKTPTASPTAPGHAKTGITGP